MFIGAGAFVGLLFFVFTSESNRQQALQPLTKLDSKFSSQISKSFISSYNLVTAHCPYSDEIFPKTLKCLNTSNISASMIESLESLYLLNQKSELEKMKLFIRNSFNCHELGWVNRHEFWSRVIGSFIGTFIISKDKFFLDEAVKCSSVLIEDGLFNEPFELVNFKQKKGKGNNWHSGVSLSSIAAGLPELLSLYHLTKQTKFLEAADSIISMIPKNNVEHIAIYNISHRNNNFETSSVDGFVVGYYHTLAIAYQLKDYEEILKILQQISSSSRLDPKSSISTLLPLLEVSFILSDLDEQISFSVESVLKKYAQKIFSSPKYPAFRPHEDSPKGGFSFDSLPLRVLMKESLHLNNMNNFTSYSNAILAALTTTQLGKGFSAMRMSKKEVFAKSYIQPSSIFGSWFSLGALIASGNSKLIRNAVFNDRGHILASKDLFNYTRD